MSTLREFVTKALLTRRIGFGDIRRLQRDILPDGITTREEAEVLIALDQAIERIDKPGPMPWSPALPGSWCGHRTRRMRRRALGCWPRSLVDDQRRPWR